MRATSKVLRRIHRLSIELDAEGEGVEFHVPDSLVHQKPPVPEKKESDGFSGGFGEGLKFGEGPKMGIIYYGIPLIECARYVAEANRVRFQVTNDRVEFYPLPEFEEEEFRIPNELFRRLNEPLPFNPFAPEETGTLPSLEGLLRSLGIQFPDGADATLDPPEGTLRMRNHLTEIQKLEDLLLKMVRADLAGRDSTDVDTVLLPHRSPAEKRGQ